VRRFRSLQGRLTMLVIGLVMAVWMATALMTWRDVRHELDELLDSHLAQAAALLVVQVQQGGEPDDDHATDAPLLHRYAMKVAFQVWHEGRLAQRSANAPLTPMRAGESPSGFSTERLAGADWRVFATRGAERDVQVFVGEQVASRQSILWAVLRGTLAPLAIALPLLALAAWWAVRQGMLPLRRLGRTLALRDPRTLEPVRSDDAPSEMQPMLAELNGLFARIAELMESERRFTADAAHELRTPIAAIRAQAQVAMAESDDALRRHALQATLQGCDRATRLVEQLLTLSRLESGGEANPAVVDLSALARRELAHVAVQAVDKGQTLELDAPQPCPVAANETLMAVLLRNLLDNAIRYSPAGATVLVRVWREDGNGQPGTVRLSVDDSGPGIDDAELQRLGERFFRVLGSGQSGSGLGWSIVRRIAAAQGARVQALRSPTLSGLRVEVGWPAARS
jgi:two-component system sensor histidine kinase QseC